LIAVSWNIHRGVSTLFRPSAHLVPRVLAETGAELVALQEAQLWRRPRHALLDERALGDEAGLRVLHPAAGEQGWRGNMLLGGPGVRLLGGPWPLALGGWEPRGGLLAEVEWQGTRLRVACAHLSLGGRRRAAQAELLLAALEDGPPGPRLLLGDLNEQRGPALALLRARLTAPPHPATFPSARPFLALDHALGHPSGLVAHVAAHATPLARRASDHLPVVARLSLR